MQSSPLTTTAFGLAPSRTEDQTEALHQFFATAIAAGRTAQVDGAHRSRGGHAIALGRVQAGARGGQLVRIDDDSEAPLCSAIGGCWIGGGLEFVEESPYVAGRPRRPLLYATGALPYTQYASTLEIADATFTRSRSHAIQVAGAMKDIRLGAVVMRELSPSGADGYSGALYVHNANPCTVTLTDVQVLASPLLPLEDAPSGVLIDGGGHESRNWVPIFIQRLRTWNIGSRRSAVGPFEAYGGHPLVSIADMENVNPRYTVSITNAWRVALGRIATGVADDIPPGVAAIDVGTGTHGYQVETEFVDVQRLSGVPRRDGSPTMRCVANPGYVFAYARVGYESPLTARDVQFINVGRGHSERVSE